MMMNQETMMQIMQNPETREKMIQYMDEHVIEMRELLSSKVSDEEFNSKMLEMMHEHMEQMQELMPMKSMNHMMK